MKILVTGGTGLVVKALQEIMPEAIYVGGEFDLRKIYDAHALIVDYKPDVIIHLAATVSGIQENILRQADHFTDNVLINTNIVDAARRGKVKRFIGMLSTCAYPDVASK